MHRLTPRRSVAVAAAASALALSAGTLAAAAPRSALTSVTNPANADRTVATSVDRGSAVVGLSLAPVATNTATKPKNGKGIAWGSTAVKNTRSALSKQRQAYRAWLRDAAPKARVTGEYDVAVNAIAVRLNGTPLSVLSGGPNVTSVGYQATYTPTAADPDLALIKAEAAWAQSGGPSDAGKGIQVGIIDTGIDATHPCFDDAGYPATQQLGDTRFTNNKVIVARVFANKAANQGLSAEAIQDHGTHVAGTVACNYQTPASVAGAAIPYAPSGVAPAAQLGNYNVFPGPIEDARSEDILNALDAAAEDGMDVINMSLGGDTHGNQDLTTNAVDNLDEANIVVAVAAGNDGPGRFTTGSPGSAEKALTAGGSTVGHFVGAPVTSGGSTVATAAFSDFEPVTADITGPLSLATGAPLGNGCTADQFGAQTAGTIALIARGTCTFSNKVFNAETAGAVAVIIVNNVPGDPVSMGTDPAFATTLSAVQVGLGTRDAMVAVAGQTVTISSNAAYVDSGFDNLVYNSSSQGPVDVSFRVKPDVVAPAVNVLSSIPQSYCDPLPAEGCWAFFQGTSMATPHLAGAAAFLRGVHPDWAAWQVRSALTNTAQEGVLKKALSPADTETDPQIIGAGLADVQAAVNAQVALSSVSTSFGAIPGRNGSGPTKALTVTNLTGSALTLPVSVTGSGAFSASASSITVPAGGSATLTVAFNPAAAGAGDNSATLRLGSVAHSVLYAFVK